MKLGEKIIAERKKRNMTQDQLAKALGVAKRSILNYELGQKYPKDRGFYYKLADYFCINVNYFLTEDEEFLTEAADKYGRRGLSQAGMLLEQTAALFAGGELSDDDKLAFLHEMQELYLDSKERSQKKFTAIKYRGTGAGSQE